MSKFAQVPQKLQDAAWKKGNTLAVYAALQRHVDHRNPAKAVWPMLTTIAAEAGVSVMTVRRELDRLRDHGWIDWESGRQGRSSRYTVYADPADNPRWDGAGDDGDGECVLVHRKREPGSGWVVVNTADGTAAYRSTRAGCDEWLAGVADDARYSGYRTMSEADYSEEFFEVQVEGPVPLPLQVDHDTAARVDAWLDGEGAETLTLTRTRPGKFSISFDPVLVLDVCPDSGKTWHDDASCSWPS